MSRNPQSSATRSPHKPPSSPAKPRVGTSTTPARTRTKSTSRATTPSKPPIENDHLNPLPALSIKEAIALKRAEAKKSKTGGSGLESLVSLEDALPTSDVKQDDDDILGRWSLREAIERARNTGSLNISTRSLPCIPSALFEIHLRITPDRLQSVPNEPPLPAASHTDTHTSRRGRRDAPAWFEAQDLQILKAWNNEIVEIQHEISLFGSLKVIDLHKNQIISLPETFADLTALTSLDLSHNALTSLPKNLFALPELTNLNISYNSLTSLPFNAPFASTSNTHSRSDLSSGRSFFDPIIIRATTPLPRLLTLDASHNKISAGAIDHTIPASITKFDLSFNPLGLEDSHCQSLFQALSVLLKLGELRFENSEIDNGALPENLLSSMPSPFTSLRLLDLGETKVTSDAAKAALRNMKQELTFDMTTADPPAGVTRIIAGKKVVREQWELEVERRTKSRTARSTETGPERDEVAIPLIEKDSKSDTKAEVVKEAWEIEAEQGLLTEGGRRRARAAAAADAAESQHTPTLVGLPLGATTADPAAQSTTGFTLTNSQYYSQNTQTLTLPPSAAASKSSRHARAISLASARPTGWSSAPSRTTDIAIPTATLPLATIVTQPFAQTLKVLVLANRRMDRSFTLPLLPEGGEAMLPNLEELNLEGCGLSDLIPVSRSSSTSGTTTPPRSNELTLPLLTRIFPSLRTLDLSYNALTSSSLTAETLSELILASPGNGPYQPLRKGLRHLRLRGNRLTELDALQKIAELFKGNREVSGWKLDELDLRDNEIGKLPPELGLMPLDVFLVDGNTFRVPQRRIWEREGTKGLLSWLRGRIE